MRDLEVFKIPLDDFTLERIDVTNKKHIRAVRGLRDRTAKKMCFDIKQDVINIKKHVEEGNSFLVRNEDGYFGYVWISNEKNDQRSMSMIIDRKLRNKGYGRMVLTGVTDYLFEHCLASAVRVYIKKKNIPSSKMAQKCGFIKDNNFSVSDVDAYDIKKR